MRRMREVSTSGSQPVASRTIGFTAQIYGLAKKAALDYNIRLRFADLEGFAAGISAAPKVLLSPNPWSTSGLIQSSAPGHGRTPA